MRPASLAGLLLCLLSSSIAIASANAGPVGTIPRVLEIRGLWYDMYGVDRALARSGGAVMTQVWSSNKGIEWYSPASSADLSRYRLIVIADIDGNAFTGNSSLNAQTIKDYVSTGGSVLFLGGFYSYGAHYRGTPLEEIAPVTFQDARDLVAGDAAVAVGPGAPSYSLNQKPIVLWMHDVAAKPGAHVVLTAGDKPLLVEGKYGQGRVAVFAGSVMGDPSPAQTPFWDWDQWPAVLTDSVEWLLAAKRTDDAATVASLTAAISATSGKDSLAVAAVLKAADQCSNAEGARAILDAVDKLPGNLSFADIDLIDERVRPAVDASCADIAKRLSQSDDPARASLGLRMLGQSHDADALRVLSTALSSGEVGGATAVDDDLSADQGAVSDPEAKAFAMRLGAIEGIGRLGDPNGLAAIRAAEAGAKRNRSPDGTFPLTPTYGDQLTTQAEIAALRCGDASDANDAIAAVLSLRATLAATMIQMSIPLVGRGSHEMELLARLNAKRAYAAAEAGKSDADLDLIGLPESVLPAIAKAMSDSDDPWMVPVAYTVFGRNFRPILPADINAILKTAKLPAIADMVMR